MSKAIGGYGQDRRCIPPAPPDGIPRCGYCHARTDLGMFRHICKEITWGTAVTPLKFISFEGE
jgi:hypothetical protein